MNKLIIAFTTVLLTQTAFAAAKSNTNCERDTKTVAAETKISIGADHVQKVAKVSAGSAIVITRRYGYGTFNVVTFWLKTSSENKSRYFELAEIDMDSDEVPNFKLSSGQTIRFSGYTMENDIGADTGLYAPVVTGSFKSTVQFKVVDPEHISVATSNCVR